MSKLDDLELLGRVRWALETDIRVPSADQIQMIVEDGVVRLWGEVRSAAEMTAAEAIARAESGTRDVDNALTVVMATPALAEEKALAAAVHQALERARGVDLRYVGVGSVVHGVVRLVGRAALLAEENAAIAAASSVSGVRQVISELVIGEVAPGQAIEVFSDATIKSMVDKAIAERGVTIYDERTLVEDGIVYLRGSVTEPGALQLAERVAAGVRGVKDIVNELQVDHTLASREPDEALSARVTQALQRDGRVSPTQVHVQCTGGDARLFGYVDSIAQQNAAIEVTKKVRGVRHVFSDIVITDRTSLGGIERERGITE